ncbi:MAG: glycosyltransferase [Verrucomicrobia bacterium]|nr:glycosyltransferase [Cytophagales bacterium]
MKNFQKIRVLECIRQGQIGGGETHVLNLVAGLNKDIFEPVVLSFTQGAMVDSLRSMNIRTEVIETEKGFDFSKWKKVKDFIKREEIDIIHAHGTRACSNVFQPARSLKLPLLYSIHGWSFHQDQNPVVRTVRELSEKFLTDRTSLNINVSIGNQEEGINRFRLRNSKIVLYGIDTQKFNAFGNYPNIRAELGIPENKTLVGYLVRMTKQKDPLTMIKALKLVADVTPDVILLVVGNGELETEVKQLVTELNLTNQVIFQNFRQDIASILSNLDAYCLPSLWEGMSIGMLEAMTMHKPVIVTPTDGVPELITNGKNGLIVPFQDPQALANAILQVHSQKDLRKSLGENAYQTMAANYFLDKMVKNIETLYKSFSNEVIPNI